MTTPLIFLDIDGVLNSHQTIVSQHKAPLDPHNIRPFNRIIRESGADIVITSTWRYWNTADELAELFDEAGIEGFIIDITNCPETDGNDHRGTEIYEWLRDHRPPEWASGKGSFVLLDDRTDMEPYLDRLVMTKLDLGLTEKHADEAIKLLKCRS